MHIVSKNCLVVVLMRNTTINKIPHQVYLHTLSAPGVWLFTLVSLVAALLPDVVIRQILLNFPR